MSHSGGVMISMLISSAVDYGWACLDQVKSRTKIGICCLSSEYIAFRSKSKDWLGWNQDDIFRVERHVYPLTVLFQWASHYKNPTKRSFGVVQSRHHHHFIKNVTYILILTMVYSWKNCSFDLKQLSLIFNHEF